MGEAVGDSTKSRKDLRWLQAPLGPQGQKSMLDGWERTELVGEEMLFLSF